MPKSRPRQRGPARKPAKVAKSANRSHRPSRAPRPAPATARRTATPVVPAAAGVPRESVEGFDAEAARPDNVGPTPAEAMQQAPNTAASAVGQQELDARTSEAVTSGKGSSKR